MHVKVTALVSGGAKFRVNTNNAKNTSEFTRTAHFCGSHLRKNDTCPDSVDQKLAQ